MAFRDDVHALHTRIETLEADLRRSTRRAAALEDEAAALRHTIVRLRSGLRDEEMLRRDRHLAVSEALLPVAGIAGVLLTVATAMFLTPYHFHGELQLDVQGVLNFIGQLERGGIATVALVLATLPLAVLPSLASVGLHMRKRFGWRAAMLAWALWTLVCPPLGAYGLHALGRRHIRELFFVEPMRRPVAPLGPVQARVEMASTQEMPVPAPLQARAAEAALRRPPS